MATASSMACGPDRFVQALLVEPIRAVVFEEREKEGGRERARERERERESERASERERERERAREGGRKRKKRERDGHLDDRREGKAKHAHAVCKHGVDGTELRPTLTPWFFTEFDRHGWQGAVASLQQGSRRRLHCFGLLPLFEFGTLVSGSFTSLISLALLSRQPVSTLSNSLLGVSCISAQPNNFHLREPHGLDQDGVTVGFRIREA